MTLDDPKPCPFCLDDEIVTRSTLQGKHWVECDTCDACGPIFDTLPEAVQAWNVVHRASAQETSARHSNLAIDPDACGSMDERGHACDLTRGHGGLHDWEQP